MLRREKNGDGVAVRWKHDGVWLSFSHRERIARTKVVAEVAGRLGLRPGTQAALMMPNCAEWMDIFLGLVCSGISVVPLDPKFGESEASHIINNSESSVLFIPSSLTNLAASMSEHLPQLQHVVILNIDGQNKKNDITSPAGVRVKFHDYAALIEEASADAALPHSFFNENVPSVDSVAAIIYTSGTTGRPKGAMLTHGNFASQIEGGRAAMRMHSNDNFLLVLPLHHAFALSCNFLIPIGNMCAVSLVENLRTIPENMREVKPTFLLSVPLLTEKLLNGIMAKVRRSIIAQTLINLGYTKIVGRKVIASLGGKLRVIVSGGASADPSVLHQINKFGLITYEGYGLTETSPMCAISPEKDIRTGTVGQALPGCELRIVDADENGAGEIEVRGPNVMKGYFRNEEATRDAFDGDWLRTGDIGTIDSDGYLSICGRKKNLIVNREGQNIYPEEVECEINSSPHILESLVLGYTVPRSKGERVGAIIVPNPDSFEPGTPRSKIEAVCMSEARYSVARLATYKHPREISVQYEPFEKTNTLKIKRYLYEFPRTIVLAD